MSGLSGVKVGDTLIMTDSSRGPTREVTVVKAGPKRIGVQGYGDRVEYFRRDTGSRDNYSFPHLQTPEEHAVRVERARLESELRDLGLTVRLEMRAEISNAKLAAVVRALREE